MNIIVTDRGSFRPVSSGVEIAYQLDLLHSTLKVDDYLRLLGNRVVLAVLKEGKTPSEIAAAWQDGPAQFVRIMQKYPSLLRR